jgi:protein ImuA
MHTKQAALDLDDNASGAPIPIPKHLGHQWARGRRTHARSAALPPEVEAAIWRGSELGSAVQNTLPSGFQALDAQLPGGGWPCQSLTELLQPQPAVAEWRLLGPAIRQVVDQGRQVVVVGPPRMPHLPGLRHAGLDERQFVWIQADTPAERLWVTEQLVKANACGLLVAWLPQARQEQTRRLQVCAQGCDAPVFLCRPMQAEHEPSAAPLRLKLRFDLDWQLQVEILKRKGPVHEGAIALPSVPAGLAPLLTPRLALPSNLIAARRRHGRELPEVGHAVGSAVADTIAPEHRRLAANGH